MGNKVLVLGVEQNNFLSFLYGTLKKTYPNFTITVPNYKELNAASEANDWMYTNEGVKRGYSISSLIKAFFSIVVTKHFFQTFFFILFFELKLKKAIHFFIESIREKAFFIRNDNFVSYDTFHFHYLQYSYLRKVFFVPKNKKIVCSFWGSDLMRTSDTFNHYFVKKVLNRATLITCQTMEMREIVLSKFGRNLLDKVQVVQFPIDDKVFQGIDAQVSDAKALSQFKHTFGYSDAKLNVQIGHNANPQNNHLQIIDALANCKEKDKLHLFVHLGYGISDSEKPSYTNELESALKSSGISYTVSEAFFTHDTLVFSRLAADLFIHTPVSDALSATMTEMLYAGSVVVSGSWLPYKTFRKIGLHYHEIDTFYEISEVVNAVLANYSIEKQACVQNKKPIKNYFFRNEIIQMWAEILS